MIRPDEMSACISLSRPWLFRDGAACYRPGMPNWLSRTLWMLAQATAIGAGMWLSFWSENAGPGSAPPQAYFVAFVGWTLFVALATGIITRLWDWSRSSLARRRAASRQPPVVAR